MHSRLYVSSLALSLFLLVGCGNSDNYEPPAPEAFPVQATQNFPSVTRVISIGQLCSGIFASPRALLTASHCVRANSRVSVQTMQGRFDTSTVVKNGPGTVGDSRDLAVVIFPQPVVPSQEIYPIGNTAVGETVHLVGYGCSDAQNRGGSGVKRAGTNSLYRISQYLEVLTPVQPPSAKGLLGPANRAGSCFGDSGGPMLKADRGTFYIVGIDHAVIPENGQQVSAYTDLSRQENLEFLRQVNGQFQLGIMGL